MYHAAERDISLPSARKRSGETLTDAKGDTSKCERAAVAGSRIYSKGNPHTCNSSTLANTADKANSGTGKDPCG